MAATATCGGERLREFESAPAAIQRAFWAELRSRIEAERDFDRWLAAVDSDEPYPAAPAGRLHRGRLRWDASWRWRCQVARQVARGEDFATEREALLAIPAPIFVGVLGGEDVPDRGGLIRCPLPDHDDRNPSFHVYPGNGWRCYGCGQQGTIYDLAAATWGLGLRGADFGRLHRRLRAVFA